MAGRAYFPPEIFGDGNRGAFVEGWYAEFLQAMGEEPLYPAAPGRPLTLRFLLLPTFSNPLLARVTAGGEVKGWRVVGKQNDGHGGYDPGPHTEERGRGLTTAEVEQLMGGLAGLGLWSLPVRDGEGGVDGSRWVLEAVEGDRYHATHRWSPEGGPFVTFCQLLLRLGGFVTERAG